jgi:hypothetical protein
VVVQGVKEQQGLYHMNSSSVQQRHQQQQQQQQQQQRERLVSWGSLNALSEQLGAQELRRLPQSLPMQYQSQIAMPSDADLDPLDPSFLASINDPCSPRRVRARAHLPSLAEAHICLQACACTVHLSMPALSVVLPSIHWGRLAKDRRRLGVDREQRKPDESGRTSLAC